MSARQYLDMLKQIKVIEDQEKACDCWPHNMPPSVKKHLFACYDAAKKLKPVIDLTVGG